MVGVGLGFSGTLEYLSPQEARVTAAQTSAVMMMLDVFIGFKFKQ
jgi:hypothetical protein